MLDEALRRGSIVVEAWGPGCGNCRRLRPLVAEVASTSEVALVEVEVDQAPELTDDLSIRSVPTLVALRDGVEVGRLVGLQTVDSVRGLFDAARDGGDTMVRTSVPAWLSASRGVAGAVLLACGMALGSVPLVLVGAMLLVWAFTAVFSR